MDKVYEFIFFFSFPSYFEIDYEIFSKYHRGIIYSVWKLSQDTLLANLKSLIISFDNCQTII